MTTSGKTNQKTNSDEEEDLELMGSGISSPSTPAILTAAGAAALVSKQVG